MEKKKKYRLQSAELVDLLIDKELEKYGVTCSQMRELGVGGTVHGTPWFSYYTFDTEEEYNQWKSFCIDILRNHVTPKLSLKRAETQFALVNLMWGLKIK